MYITFSSLQTRNNVTLLINIRDIAKYTAVVRRGCTPGVSGVCTVNRQEIHQHGLNNS